MLSSKYRLRHALHYGSAILLFATLSGQCPALTILSGPNLTPATNAPLAGLLQLSTDADSRVGISVYDGNETWTRDFYDFATNHAVPLLGFKPGRTNQLTVRVYDRNQNSVVAAQPLSFVTAPLPSDFPNVKLLQSDPARMEPGYTLFRVALNSNRKGYETIVDQAGEVVWYSPVTTMLDIRQLTNGDLFYFSLTNFVEMNMLGQTVQSWSVPTNLRVNLHDGVPTEHGTILYLSDAVAVVSNYPTSTTIPNAATTTATNLVYQHVVEISQTNSALPIPGRCSACSSLTGLPI